MKYKIKQSGKTQKTIECHISKEMVSDELDSIYQEISKTATLPGYRVGKAPTGLVKKRYKKEATDEVMRKLLTDSFKKAITESDIEILGHPEVFDLQFDEEKGMSYKATVNIRPQLKLKNYKGLSLKRLNKEVKEQDIDSQINTLREMNAKFAAKDGNAIDGDYIICDLECIVENHPDEKKENVWLHVSDDAFIPGKSLEGLKVNDEKDVEKVLPDNYSKKELAGKKANFHIKVKELKEKILPELNDEFASIAGDFHSMAELREAIRLSLEKMKELDERRDLENQALKLLDEMAVFDVPQFMVEKHFEVLLNKANERLKREQFSEDEIKSMEKDFKERLKIEAIRQVRTYFILDEIAKLENIKVDEMETEETFKMLASSSSRSADEVRRYYEKEDLIEDLKEELKQRKVLDFVIKNATLS